MNQVIKIIKKILVLFYVSIIETLALIICLLLYPFKSTKLDLPKGQSGNKPDILCVHGFLHNETPWAFFRWYLQASGAGPINTVYYPSFLQGIPQNSLKIKERIEQIKMETNREVTVLIGHSLGGIECLEYALEYAPKDRIINVITLGSPLHGTSLAFIGLRPSVKQMRIGSPYLKSLHERLEKASHIRVLTVASKNDPLIHPGQSALLPNSQNAESVELDGLGHLSLLFSCRVLKTIVAYLHSYKLIPTK